MPANVKGAPLSHVKRSSINMLASLIGYSVPMLANLISTPMLLTGLGEAAFGLQSLVSVIIGYFTILDMGLAWPVIKYLAEDHAKNDIEAENRILSTTLQLYVAIGIVGMVIIFFAAEWFVRSVFKIPENLIPQATLVFRLAGLGFLGTMGASWGQALAMGLQRFEISYGVSAVSTVVGIGVGLGSVYAGYGVVGYVSVRVVVSLISGPAYWLTTGQFFPTFRLRWGMDRATLRRVSGYLGYGAIQRVIGGVISRLDQTLVGIWVGVAAAGVYSVPFLVINSLSHMIGYMLGFIFPLASELKTLGQMVRLQDIFTRATRFVTATAGMIFCPLLVFGDIFLVLWVPTIAAESVGVLRLLTVAGYLGTLSISLTSSVVVGMGYMREFTIYSIIRGVVMSASCVLLIRPFGLIGAGCAALLTVIVADFVFLMFVLHNYLKLSVVVLWRTAYRGSIVLSLCLSLLFWLTRQWGWVATWLGLMTMITLFEITYISIGFRMRVFGDTEKRALRGLWNKIAGRAWEIDGGGD